MSTNNVKNIKAILGVVAITSLTTLTPPANAKTLDSTASVQNLMSQAKLSLGTPTKQSDKFEGIASLEKLEVTNAAKDSNCGCNGGNCSCKPKKAIQ